MARELLELPPKQVQSEPAIAVAARQQAHQVTVTTVAATTAAWVQAEQLPVPPGRHPSFVRSGLRAARQFRADIPALVT